MNNPDLDIDVVQYSEIAGQLLASKKVSKVVELFPQYTLLLNEMRRTGIRNYLGIEPEYPERTSQAIKYYSSLGRNGVDARIINQEPLIYLSKYPDSTDNVAFISYKMDGKTSNLEELAKILYDISSISTLNIHLALKDNGAFIDAGFRKEGNIYLKK